jgi:hypothetical protein
MKNSDSSAQVFDATNILDMFVCDNVNVSGGSWGEIGGPPRPLASEDRWSLPLFPCDVTTAPF